MAGSVGIRSAILWLQGEKPGHLRVEYWPQLNPSARRRSEPYLLRKEEDYVAHVTLENLEPGEAYGYKILIDGRDVSPGKLRFKTQPLWQWRGEPPDFLALIGSCAYINDPRDDRPGHAYGGDYGIFDAMSAKKPDLTLWLGDNVYFREADNLSRGGMAYRYRHDRALPELRRLLMTGQHYAIWDDHDFGPNDSNSSYIYKDQSLLLFQRYWANPSYGTRETPGVFTVVSYGDVDFFLLDDRYYRDSDKTPAADKTMFGAAQMHWLKNALLNSTATFKLIAAGSQMLNDSNPYEGWNHFPAERQDFLDWLGQAKINGVLFVSGDRHHTELIRRERDAAYAFYELTCSPLTAGVHSKLGDEKDNPARVEATLVTQHNFCSLEFSGPRAKRRITLSAFAASGERLWQKQLRVQDLSN